MSFSVRHECPALIWCLILVLLLLCLLLAYYTWDAWDTYQKWRLGLSGGGDFAKFLILLLLFLSLLNALAMALALGEANFKSNSSDSYMLSKLNSYTNVNPSGVDGNGLSGLQLMDAGLVAFAEGTKINVTLTEGFKSHDTYCVAPLVGDSATAGKQRTYDIWVVGKNCCSGLAGSSFACGAYDNPYANGGIRLMDDEARPFYRMAVQEAEASYKIKALHPIFFEWVPDAFEEAKERSKRRFVTFAYSLWGFVIFQVFITVCVGFYLIRDRKDILPGQQ